MGGRLEGKVALITGAGSGVGQATSLVFAREGASVVVAELVAERAQKTVDMIKQAGGKATVAVADVSKADDCRKMIETAVETFGKIDILFNNAGYQIIGPIEGPFEDLTTHKPIDGEVGFDKTMNIMVKGTWLGTRYAVPQMKKQGTGGVIISTSSYLGLVGGDNNTSYCAAKFAIVGMTKAWAIELLPWKIRVNTICPGALLTPFSQALFDTNEEVRRSYESVQGRLGKPEDIANAALYLASDESEFLTGVALPVDGSFTAR